MHIIVNSFTNKIEGVYDESVDPPSYEENIANQIRNIQNLVNNTILELASKNVKSVNVLKPLNEHGLLSRMYNLVPNKIIIAFRQNQNPSGAYHYMIYYNGM